MRNGVIEVKGSEQVALVTGSSRGIGEAIAHRLAARGATVVVNAHRSAEQASEVARALADAGHTAVALRADVGDPQDVKRLFSQIDRRFGRIDFLVNCAGTNRDVPIASMTADDWDVVLGSQLGGTFFCSREAAVRMKRQGGGRILNIGAATGIRGRKNGANYCAAKAGIMAITKCFALEFAPEVLTNCLVPGFTETADIRRRFHLEDPERRAAFAADIPMGRLARPEEIARWAEFVLYDAPYSTGANVFVNGGSYLG